MTKERRGGMDEISKSIGALEADAEAGKRQRTELFTQIGGVKSDLHDIKNILTQNTEKVSAMLTKHDGKLNSHAVDIKGLKAFRTKMYLGIAAISGTGGIVGAVMTKLGFK